MNVSRTEDNTESFKEVAALTLTSEETVTLDIYLIPILRCIAIMFHGAKILNSRHTILFELSNE